MRLRHERQFDVRTSVSLTSRLDLALTIPSYEMRRTRRRIFPTVSPCVRYSRVPSMIAYRSSPISFEMPSVFRICARWNSIVRGLTLRSSAI